MHFYPHNIADFNNATRHLTRVERSVYRDSIDLYYDTESPLIPDFEKLAKRLLCSSDEEKEALKAVLDEFFDLEEDGYHCSRCDIEIEKYRANTSAKARAGKASGESRRKKKEAKKEQDLTGVEQVLNTSSTEAEQNPTKQELITNNQEPLIQSKDLVDKSTPKPKRKKRLPDDFVLSPHLRALACNYWVENNRPDLNPDQQFEQFTNHHRAKGSVMACWESAWKTWYTNSVAFNRAANQPKSKRGFVETHTESSWREGL